jgi:apolipoprotein N-acyltransferase
VSVHLGRCSFFWLWALVGGALLLSVISFIGVITGPVALVALLLVARRSPRWPEPLGLLAGFGVLCLVVASISWRHEGVDPVPWLAGGIALSVLGVAVYGAASRSSPP